MSSSLSAKRLEARRSKMEGLDVAAVEVVEIPAMEDERWGRGCCEVKVCSRDVFKSPHDLPRSREMCGLGEEKLVTARFRWPGPPSLVEGRRTTLAVSAMCVW